jgi:peptidoglycan/LPS O-acetylase OafA/YrhL
MQTASLKTESRNVTVQPAVRSKKLDALTSLRIFAAGMAVFMHAEGLLSKGYPSFVSHLAWEQCVSFFFVLSGFILFYNYPVLENSRSVARFLIARVARIWPAYITIFALIAFTSNKAQEVSLSILASTVAMLNSLVPNLHYCMNLNPPAWSVSTEFCFYLMFPFLVASWKDTWWWKLSITGATVILSLLLAATSNISGDFFWHSFLYMNPIVRVFEFTIGMVTAGAFLRLREEWHNAGNRQNALQIDALQISAVLAVVASLIVCSVLTRVEQSPVVHNSLLHWFRTSGGAPAYAFLIFAMAFVEGKLAQCLSNKVWVTLGEISYSVYLVHFPLLWLALVHRFDWFGAIPDIPLYVLSIGAILSASWLMFTFVETPARKSIPRLVFGAR